MMRPRTYKQIHPSKQSQASKAEADYAEGSYENARQSPLWMEYYMAYFDRAALEMKELNSEIQGN